MSEALKRLRSKKLITQEEVSKRLGISRQTYNNYENNIELLSLKQIQDILISLESTNEEVKEFFCEIEQDIMSGK